MRATTSALSQISCAIDDTGSAMVQSFPFVAEISDVTCRR